MPLEQSIYDEIYARWENSEDTSYWLKLSKYARNFLGVVTPVCAFLTFLEHKRSGIIKNVLEKSRVDEEDEAKVQQVSDDLKCSRRHFLFYTSITSAAASLGVHMHSYHKITENIQKRKQGGELTEKENRSVVTYGKVGRGSHYIAAAAVLSGVESLYSMNRRSWFTKIHMYIFYAVAFYIWGRSYDANYDASVDYALGKPNRHKAEDVHVMTTTAAANEYLESKAVPEDEGLVYVGRQVSRTQDMTELTDVITLDTNELQACQNRLQISPTECIKTIYEYVHEHAPDKLHKVQLKTDSIYNDIPLEDKLVA